MMYINHRINTIQELNKVPFNNGIEIDVRYHNNDLILHHDPFNHHNDKAELLENLLREWKHSGPIILNIKTEGIEQPCIDIMHKYNIIDWFFLDLSMPYFAIYAEHAARNNIKGFSKSNLAVRFSEREPIEYALSFENKASWVWIDCFTKLPINDHNYTLLKKAGFKICIVSPELQQHSINRIAEFKGILHSYKIDAICTKRPDLWETY